MSKWTGVRDFALGRLDIAQKPLHYDQLSNNFIEDDEDMASNAIADKHVRRSHAFSANSLSRLNNGKTAKSRWFNLEVIYRKQSPFAITSSEEKGGASACSFSINPV